MRVPFVSVVVATYNSEKYIHKALNSILAQECHFDLEILIGDDSSTDETYEILSELAEQHANIRLFKREYNIGAAQNYLLLLSEAKGKYIAMLDGDDYWIDPLKLKTQVEFLETHPEYSGCAHKALLVDECDNVLKKQRLRFVKKRKRFTFEDFQGYYLPGQPCTFLKRNIFIDKQNIDKLSAYCDICTTDRFSIALYLSMGDFGFIDKIMSAYRISDTSITASEKNRINTEYFTTCKLEEFCSCLLNRKIVFYKYRRELFISALFSYILGNKSLLKIALAIKNETGRLAKMISYIPIWVINKIIIKLTCSR